MTDGNSQSELLDKRKADSADGGQGRQGSGPSIALPAPGGRLERYTLGPPAPKVAASGAARNRVAISAAHVVSDPWADVDPWLQPAIDWDATIEYRRYLWSLGLGVAEAMDTAQRGMGLDWPTSLELIQRALDAARDFGPGALIASGAGTDHLAPARTSPSTPSSPHMRSSARRSRPPAVA